MHSFKLVIATLAMQSGNNLNVCECFVLGSVYKRRFDGDSKTPTIIPNMMPPIIRMMSLYISGESAIWLSPSGCCYYTTNKTNFMRAIVSLRWCCENVVANNET